MAGNKVAGVLGAELPLHPGFEQITSLRHTDSNNATAIIAILLNEPNRAATNSATIISADRTGNRAQTMSSSGSPPAQFRATEGAAGKIAEDIGRPDDRKQQHDHDANP